MQWNILSPITITISRRPMCRRRILILKRILRSTMRSISCAILQQRPLSERKDVIIVASVSCIYGLGSPIDYKEMVISLRPGMEKDRDEVIRKLIDIQYDAQ